MAKKAVVKSNPKAGKSSVFKMAPPEVAARAVEKLVHKLQPGVVCRTDTKGQPSPRGRSPAELVLDAPMGIIPLWARDVTLGWRFQEQSMAAFENPELARTEIKAILGDAILAWGEASPVKFAHRTGMWDFEIVMRSADDCEHGSCTLAMAFFPDAGRHELVLYPKLFEQSREEQVETLAHELGHIFGLRHFFANISETRWPSEFFGAHKPFSIMNYGVKSVMTEDDRADLKRLYQGVWSRQITDINGTPVRLVEPYSVANSNPFALAMAATVKGEAVQQGRSARGCCCCCSRS